MRVHNDGAECWPGGERLPLIRLAHRWVAADGTLVLAESARTALTAPLPAGASDVACVLVEAPREPGRYGLRFDLVHEDVRWFGCESRESREIQFDVL